MTSRAVRLRGPKSDPSRDDFESGSHTHWREPAAATALRTRDRRAAGDRGRERAGASRGPAAGSAPVRGRDWKRWPENARGAQASLGARARAPSRRFEQRSRLRYPLGGAALTSPGERPSGSPRPARVLLVLLLLSGCSVDTRALAPASASRPDAAGDSGRPDSIASMDSSPPMDAPADTSTPRDTSVLDAADSAPADTSVPDADATIDTSMPPTCADRFSSSSGFTSVCSDSATRCVLEIDVDPDRRTCTDVCADIGWSCEGAAGAASTVPRCDEAPIAGDCDTNLRIQVCACVPP